METPIASLSISARVTLDMHSLNNEGGEGNQIQTRMVDIVGADGRLHNVNAISGDMLKHIQAQHFFELARAEGLPLCAGCLRFDANRINADRAWLDKTAKFPDRDALDDLLKTCALDDIAGILITEGKKSLPRKSVVEFGWVVGIPEIVTSGSYFHVKYANERGTERRDEDAKEREAGANRGQAIFHRPASSGVYAIVCHLELGRIGYNDITQRYALDDAERGKRARLLVQSLLHTFVELNGAMRATQLPHLVGLEGVCTYSASGAIPAPMVSPLAGGRDDHDTYKSQIEAVAGALNGSRATVSVRPFTSLGGFATLARELVDTLQPVKLVTGRA